MPPLHRLVASCLASVVLLALCGEQAVGAEAGAGPGAVAAAKLAVPPLVSVGVDGQLSYRADAFGNGVPDFALAGYRNGGMALPVAPVLETLQPAGSAAASQDDTARIQAALDRAAKAPARADDGVRGAVLLARGLYHCGKSLHVGSGVTLRGEGQDQAGTVIVATQQSGDKPTLIELSGARAAFETGAAHTVLDATLPIGAKVLELEGGAALAPGDAVLVERVPNQAWIHDLKMDQIEKLGKDGKQWSAAGFVLRWQARVAGVQGNRITLDTPLICALERRYDVSTVRKITADGRGRGAAVESVRLVSAYSVGRENSDENHAWVAVQVGNLVDSWVREVTAVHFAYSCVNVGKSAARITVQDCAMLEPVSLITGGRRYSFVGGGQFVLFQRCYARDGRHDFVTGHADVGPTVFLDCLAEETNSDLGPHHRWSSGQLYDNVKGGMLHVQDRGPSGTGHGWAGNAQVFWNCEVSKSLVCQKAWLPSAQNWLVGCRGPRGKPMQPKRPDGLWESWGTPVAPRSLYLTQLRARFLRAGDEAAASLVAVTTVEQREGRAWQALHRRYEADRSESYERGKKLARPKGD